MAPKYIKLLLKQFLQYIIGDMLLAIAMQIPNFSFDICLNQREGSVNGQKNDSTNSCVLLCLYFHRSEIHFVVNVYFVNYFFVCHVSIHVIYLMFFFSLLSCKLYEWFNSCVLNSEIQTACFKICQKCDFQTKKSGWMQDTNPLLLFVHVQCIHASLIFMSV